MTGSVSVVIPTYNRAGLVERAVGSVLSQTRPPAEVIVVDDCSTDETAQALSTFGDEIRIARLPENRERGAARNLGAELAQGSLVAFLDSDDEWEPEKLARQLELPDRASVTGIRHVDERGQQLGPVFIPRRDAQSRIAVRNTLLGAASSLLLEKQLVRGVGGFPEARQVQGSEDWLFLARLTRAGVRIGVVGAPMVRYRVHPDNWTGNASHLARSMWAACDLMEREQSEEDAVAAERRSRAAGVVACAYLVERDVGSAWRWSRRALGQGSVRVRARSGRQIMRTAGGLALKPRRR